MVDQDDKCFACGKRFGASHGSSAGRRGMAPARVATSDGQTVFVGPDCARRTWAAGADGYQPPKGGPRLYGLAVAAVDIKLQKYLLT